MDPKHIALIIIVGLVGAEHGIETIVPAVATVAHIIDPIFAALSAYLGMASGKVGAAMVKP